MSWLRRTRELHDELAAIADLDLDPRWWLVAGGAAVTEHARARGAYLISDAEPGADTFIGVARPAPDDPIADAIARAHAARAALRELDGRLPDQPLAVTLHRDHGATVVPNRLDVAAFAIGDRVIVARLDAPDLAARLASRTPATEPADVPFVCVSIGDEPIETARHGHRRAWRNEAGPWLGLGRAGGLAVVSTCHMVVDGYGHAWLAAAIAQHHARIAGARQPRVPGAPCPPLAPVAGAMPLGVAWRELPMPAPRALPLGYRLGCVLHRRAGRPAAPFSPTFQIPVAPGRPDDPERRLRRVVPSAMSVRFAHGEPEPYEVFEARARAILAREADRRGLCSRLLAAASAMPLSLAWKRKTFSATRPAWLDHVAEVMGGRACVSRIRLALPMPPACAVSSPARLASASDPLGACVITVIESGTHAAITACGSGLAGSRAEAAALLDELLSDASSDRARARRTRPPAHRR